MRQPRQRQQLHGDTDVAKPSAGVAIVGREAVSGSATGRVVAAGSTSQACAGTTGCRKTLVNADNSALSGILHDISAKTGMTVDGLSRDQRIFGSYGPSAREVLSALLDGLGYNVMMAGASPMARHEH